MRFALTDPDGTVVNVIVWPDDQPPPAEWGGYTAHDVTGERVGPGWARETDGTWTPPEPPADPTEGDHLDPQIGTPHA